MDGGPGKIGLGGLFLILLILVSHVFNFHRWLFLNLHPIKIVYGLKDQMLCAYVWGSYTVMYFVKGSCSLLCTYGSTRYFSLEKKEYSTHLLILQIDILNINFVPIDLYASSLL